MIKRFSPTEDYSPGSEWCGDATIAVMEEDERGEYVRHADYTTLWESRGACEAKVASLQRELSDVRRAMETRRRRMAHAIELLGRNFKLRPYCCRIEDAVADAIGEEK